MGSTFIKPSIVKPSIKLRWNPGEQSYKSNSGAKVSKVIFDGVHWQMVDVDNAVIRNHKNNIRLSKENIMNKWGVKNFTEGMIREECEKHLHDPQLF